MLRLSCYPNVCYADEFHQTYVAISTLSFAYKHFKQVSLIKNFHKLKSLVCNMQTDENYLLIQENHEFSHFLAGEKLYDSIKLSICFENYIKAALLSQGFVIHTIDRKVNNKKYKNLYERQQSEPISISELKTLEPFSTDDINKKYVIEALKNYTLGLSSILDEHEYMKYLPEIDGNLKQFILSYYQTRNTLHFAGSPLFLLSPDLINMLGKLIHFINKNIVHKHNDLIMNFTDKYNQTPFLETPKLSEI